MADTGQAAAKAQLKASNDERAKQVEAASKSAGKPTPTQEENDLAKLGFPVDPKEPDGSGPVVITRTVVANQPLAAGGYETRAVAAADKAAREAVEKESKAAEKK